MSVPTASLFSPKEGWAYLDTATYGLPPRPTIDAMNAALRQWQEGSAYWIDDWDVTAEQVRRSFADLVEVDLTTVALIPAASVGVGTVAASLSEEDRVLVPDDDFTSLLFPLLVAEQRGVEVVQVPFAELVAGIGPGVTMVATSLVQMQTGKAAPLEAIVEKSHQVGAKVLLDATHGLPFLGMGGILAEVDYTVTAAYKHLLCPRGVGFLTVRPEHQLSLDPWNANWRAADDPYGRYFGGPLTLAEGAGRFDVSPAWLPWTGAAASLDLLVGWQRDGSLRRPLEQATELAERLGAGPAGSTLVCAPVDDVEQTKRLLNAARIKAGFRGDGVRLATHVYTTADDIDRAVAALRTS